MREIKFRVWHKKENKMHDVAEIRIGFSRFDVDDSHNEAFVGTECLDAILMQYTGLKDKNGKEIYEGDVVRRYFNWCDMDNPYYDHIDNHDKYKSNVYMSMTIEFCEEDHGWVTGNTANRWNVKNGIATELEVIGNIHENPELLENK